MYTYLTYLLLNWAGQIVLHKGSHFASEIFQAHLNITGSLDKRYAHLKQPVAQHCDTILPDIIIIFGFLTMIYMLEEKLVLEIKTLAMQAPNYNIFFWQTQTCEWWCQRGRLANARTRGISTSVGHHLYIFPISSPNYRHGYKTLMIIATQGQSKFHKYKKNVLVFIHPA